MKRSDAIKKLMPKCISHFEVLRQESYDNGEYYRRAESLLNFIEKELRMSPPPINKKIKDIDEETSQYIRVQEWEQE